MRARRGTVGTTAVVAAIVVLPVIAVLVGLVPAGLRPWTRLGADGLLPPLLTTLALVALTVTGSVVLGGGLAWLTYAYRFPGRRAFGWLLVLPAAVPGYILGLVYSSLLSYRGPVRSASRSVFGADSWFPPVRSLPVAAAVLVLTLYPYVYLLTRAALQDRAASTYGAARVLGATPWQAARRVVLPMARPALAAGGFLVAVETLADFATVQFFDVHTLSVSIYQVWRGEFDRAGATVLSLVVLAVALGLFGAERLARRGARYAATGAPSAPIPPVALTGPRAWLATGGCAAVLFVAVVIPLVQLAAWSSTTPVTSTTGGVDGSFFVALVNSALLSGYTAVAVVVVAALVVHAARLDPSRQVRLLSKVPLTGYLVPAPVLAIGALLLFAAGASGLDLIGLPGGDSLVTGTVAGLVFAYAVRFLALGQSTLDASMAKVPLGVTAAALSLGARPRRVLAGVHLPLLRSGLGVATVLVAVDALKELPIVLLLRPFGFDTLSIRVWQLAADSRYEAAGLPALTIVVVAMLPVLLLFRRGEQPATEFTQPAEPHAEEVHT